MTTQKFVSHLRQQQEISRTERSPICVEVDNRWQGAYYGDGRSGPETGNMGRTRCYARYILSRDFQCCVYKDPDR